MLKMMDELIALKKKKWATVPDDNWDLIYKTNEEQEAYANFYLIQTWAELDNTAQKPRIPVDFSQLLLEIKLDY